MARVEAINQSPRAPMREIVDFQEPIVDSDPILGSFPKASVSGPERYDSELQMFVDTPREAKLDGLRFLRWLAEQGKLEHEPFGQSSGAYTTKLLLEASEPA